MNVRQSVRPIYSTVFGRKVVLAYTTDPGAPLVPGPEVHLIKDADFVVGPGVPRADYIAVEADFTDYVAAPLTLAAPNNLGPDVEGAVGVATYSMSTNPTVVSNTVYGYWVEDTGGVVVAAESFGAGNEVVMSSPGDLLLIIIALPCQLYQTPAG